MEAWRYVHITVIMDNSHIQWSRGRTQLNRKANLFIELNHLHIHLSLFVFILLCRTYTVTGLDFISSIFYCYSLDCNAVIFTICQYK